MNVKNNISILLLLVLVITLTQGLRAETAAGYNDSGLDLYNKKDYEKAIEFFDKALEIDPSIPTVWNNKGLALYQLGKHEDALTCFTNAVELDPKYINGLYNRGSVLIQLKKFDEALLCFNDILKINKNHKQAIEKKEEVQAKLDSLKIDDWFLDGQNYFNEEKYSEAVDLFKKVKEVNSAFPEIDVWLEKALFALEKEMEMEESKDWFSQGVSLYEEGKYEEAIALFNKVIEANPKHSEVYTKLEEANLALEKQLQIEALTDKLAKGNNLYSEGKYIEAIEIFDDLLIGDSEYAPALFSKGLSLININQYHEGIKYIQNSINLDPNLETIDIYLIDKNGNTPLHVSSKNSQDDLLAIAVILLNKGVDVNIKNDTGDTPLHLTGRTGNYDLSKLMISSGALVNSQNDNGNTPLHLAARSGNKELVQLLLENGSITTTKNNNGETPVNMARDIIIRELIYNYSQQ